MKNKMVLCFILIACLSSSASAGRNNWRGGYPVNSLQIGFMNYINKDTNPYYGYLGNFGIRLRNSNHLLGAGCYFISKTEEDGTIHSDEDNLAIYGQWVYARLTNEETYARVTLGMVNMAMKKKEGDDLLADDSKNHGFVTVGVGMKVIYFDCEIGGMMYDRQKSVDGQRLNPKFYFVLGIEI